jgi:hypothetical protein
MIFVLFKEYTELHLVVARVTLEPQI